MAALCKELELLGRAGGGDAVPPLVARAEAEVARVVAALSAQLDGGGDKWLRLSRARRVFWLPPIVGSGPRP